MQKADGLLMFYFGYVVSRVFFLVRCIRPPGRPSVPILPLPAFPRKRKNAIPPIPFPSQPHLTHPTWIATRLSSWGETCCVFQKSLIFRVFLLIGRGGIKATDAPPEWPAPPRQRFRQPFHHENAYRVVLLQNTKRTIQPRTRI